MKRIEFKVIDQNGESCGQRTAVNHNESIRNSIQRVTQDDDVAEIKVTNGEWVVVLNSLEAT